MTLRKDQLVALMNARCTHENGCREEGFLSYDSSLGEVFHEENITPIEPFEGKRRSLHIKRSLQNQKSHKRCNKYKRQKLRRHCKRKITRRGRQAKRDLASRWPGGVVAYKLSNSLSSALKAQVKEAMAEISADVGPSCISFREAHGKEGRIVIGNYHDSKCHSDVGYWNGPTHMDLGCKFDRSKTMPGKGVVIHELLHTLGIWHQQNRADRDTYVTIKWSNIKNYVKHPNFDRFDRTVVQNFGLPYDYDSIMHYNAYGGSRNGHKTIETKGGQAIGQRNHLSTGDKNLIKHMYNCFKENNTFHHNTAGSRPSPPLTPRPHHHHVHHGTRPHHTSVCLWTANPGYNGNVGHGRFTGQVLAARRVANKEGCQRLCNDNFHCSRWDLHIPSKTCYILAHARHFVARAHYVAGKKPSLTNTC